ncbi:MAG: hypothetical protein ACOX0D_07085 [Sphaerochaeta sp.]|jgi:hypothetical protein|nr:hypothetical protein [Sphaerochaeta sp.]
MKGMSPGEIRDSCLKGEIEAKTALAVLGVMLERVYEQYKDYEHYRKERIVEPDKIFTDYDKKIFEGQRKVNQIMQEGVDIDQYMTQIETAFPQNKPEEAPAKTKEGLETIETSIKELESSKEPISKGELPCVQKLVDDGFLRTDRKTFVTSIQKVIDQIVIIYGLPLTPEVVCEAFLDQHGNQLKKNTIKTAISRALSEPISKK